MVTSDRATRVGYGLAKELEKANKAFIDHSSYDPNTKTIVIFYADLDESYIDFEVGMATTDLTLENRQLKKQLEMLKAENEKLKKENDTLEKIERSMWETIDSVWQIAISTNDMEEVEKVLRREWFN